ncbi:MAG: nucleotide exchange factor GrpE [Ignavibacteria bacterium RBG_16_36_9]|nr:MAG: nucleotide exchange factor GrpE [Ignavibacteria bacterium RBG_16_36_9]
MTKHKKDKPQEDQNKMTEPEENKSETIEKNEETEVTALDKAETKIAELEVQVKDWQDKLLRKAAEFENYKRRTENDQFNLINYAAESFIVKLLPVVDDFERSMEHIDDIDNNNAVKAGIKLVYEKFLKLLNEQGVKKMQTKGEPFNVDYHDALMQRKDDSVPPHTVLEEVESGYLYRDKVIRHAKVIVSEESSSDDNQMTNEDSLESSSENEK